MSRKRIVIKCDDDTTRVRWRNLCNIIDDEKDYEEIVQMLCNYFDEDQSRIDQLVRENRKPEFR